MLNKYLFVLSIIALNTVSLNSHTVLKHNSILTLMKREAHSFHCKICTYVKKTGIMLSPDRNSRHQLSGLVRNCTCNYPVGTLNGLARTVNTT